MSVKYNIDTFPVASPSALLANNYGAHILSVELQEDAWNGSIIGVGDWIDFEYYEEAEVGEFEGKIVKQMANGNWLIQVLKAENAFLIYNPPVVETEWTNNFKKESNFYLKAGVDMARAHELKQWDRFELSSNGFTGDEPQVGATISAVSGRKPVLVAPASV